MLGIIDDIRRMKSMCSPGMDGLPGQSRDFRRQNSLGFLCFQRMIVSGFTLNSSDLNFFQTLEIKAQNSLSRFHPIAFFDLRLYTINC
jgi:hypothetical protein